MSANIRYKNLFQCFQGNCAGSGKFLVHYGKIFQKILVISPRCSYPKSVGFEIEKSAIRMPAGPLKVIGETPLEVVLHGDVMATITVAVVVEQPKL